MSNHVSRKKKWMPNIKIWIDFLLNKSIFEDKIF